jgi:uncharacterized protein DUF2630
MLDRSRDCFEGDAGVVKVVVCGRWDLLRQRRALSEAGRDPNAADTRRPDVVEGYEQ